MCRLRYKQHLKYKRAHIQFQVQDYPNTWEVLLQPRALRSAQFRGLFIDSWLQKGEKKHNTLMSQMPKIPDDSSGMIHAEASHSQALTASHWTHERNISYIFNLSTSPSSLISPHLLLKPPEHQSLNTRKRHLHREYLHISFSYHPNTRVVFLEFLIYNKHRNRQTNVCPACYCFQ